jgi:hypothetical protein
LEGGKAKLPLLITPHNPIDRAVAHIAHAIEEQRGVLSEVVQLDIAN